jgi:anti-anti-sigma regulatory factor
MSAAESPTLLVARAADAYVVQVRGRGTLRESRCLHEYARCILSVAGNRVVVDLSACDYLDSTFLGCLVQLHRQNAGGAVGNARVQLAAGPAKVAALLAPLKLDKLFHILPAPPAMESEAAALPAAAADPYELGQHVMECHRRLAELGGPQQDAFARIADHLAHDLERNRPRPANPPT